MGDVEFVHDWGTVNITSLEQYLHNKIKQTLFTSILGTYEACCSKKRYDQTWPQNIMVICIHSWKHTTNDGISFCMNDTFLAVLLNGHVIINNGHHHYISHKLHKQLNWGLWSLPSPLCQDVSVCVCLRMGKKERSLVGELMLCGWLPGNIWISRAFPEFEWLLFPETWLADRLRCGKEEALILQGVQGEEGGEIQLITQSKSRWPITEAGADIFTWNVTKKIIFWGISIR